MNLKWFVTFIAIGVVTCIKSIQKIAPKYNTQASNPDLVTLTLPSDKNSFPDVVYPTSILDIAQPYYFNTDNDFKGLVPFSEDVKSSYKLLSLINKAANKDSPANVKNLMEINDKVKDVVINVSVHENITNECHNNNKEDCIHSFVLEESFETENNTNSILVNTEHNNDNIHVSFPQETRNEYRSKIPIHVKINIQVFKQSSDKNKEEENYTITNNLISQDNEEKTTNFKEVNTYPINESSEEINSSSEEHYTELQDISHSDFIKVLSLLLLDLLNDTDNATETTLIENESLERVAIESVDNLPIMENCCFMESNSTDLTLNRTHSDYENILNLTELFRNNDGESIKDSKEENFLDFFISLDSFCENNNTVDTFGDSGYFTNHEYLRSENFTII